MEKKMTAIDYFIEKLTDKIGVSIQSVMIDDINITRELFREQIEDAYSDGRANEHFDTIINSSNYFTQTYSEPLKDKI